MKPIIAVVGCHRSGTSALAGVLHSLGCSMGTGFQQSRACPKGTYEDDTLLQYLLQAIREEKLTETSTRSERVAWLREYRKTREEPGWGIGLKHPLLCLVVGEMAEAWPDVRLIFIDRPIEESERSLSATEWPWAKPRSPSFIRQMLDARESVQLAEPPLRIDYADLIERPEETIDRIIAWLGLDSANRQQAIDAIDPSLRRFTAGIAR